MSLDGVAGAETYPTNPAPTGNSLMSNPAASIGALDEIIGALDELELVP